MDKVVVIGICGKSIFLGCDKFPSKGEKGVNTAVTINRLGGKVAYLVSLGNDEYGKECVDFFKKENLDVKCLIKNGTTDYGVIMHRKDGNNCVSVFIDDNVKLSEKDVSEFEDEIKDARYAIMSAEVGDDVLLKACELCLKYKVKIIFDPSPIRTIPEEFLKNVWLFTPNETEYKDLFKIIKPKNAVITLGRKGAVLIENGKTVKFPAVKVNVENTTGAGDVFNGALCFALSVGKNLKESVRFAMQAAAYKVTRRYVIDGIPTKECLNDKVC